MLLFWQTSGALACLTGPSLLFLADDFSVSAFARVLVGLYSSGIFTYFIVFVLFRHGYWPESAAEPALVLPNAHDLVTIRSAEWWLEDSLSAGMAAAFAGSVVAAYSPYVARVQLLWAGGYSLLVLVQGTLASLGVVGNIAQGPTPLTSPSLMMKLIAYEHQNTDSVLDPVRGVTFRAPVPTELHGTTVWNLTSSSMERTAGPLWDVGRTYTQCFWLFWRQADVGERSVFRGSRDYSIIIESGSKRLGTYSSREGQFSSCAPEYTIDVTSWNFICVTGESESADGTLGRETVYISTDESPPQAVCTAERVIPGPQPHFVTVLGQGAGYIAAAMHWSTKLEISDMAQAQMLTIPASLKAPTPMNSPDLQMQLVAASQQGSAVKDPVSGTEFGNHEVTTYKGVPVWDLNDGFLERSWGEPWYVKDSYTQCFWVFWRKSAGQRRTLFSGTSEQALVTGDHSNRLGSYSNSKQRWVDCDPKYTVDVSRWNFICAVGNASAGSLGSGAAAVYVSKDLALPVKVGEIGHVVSGSQLYRVGWPNQGPGYVAAALHWNKILTEDEISQVFLETVPLGMANSAICNAAFLVWMIATPIAVACGYPRQQKRVDAINSLALAGVGSYIAISGVVWATIVPAPDFDDVTFFIHHSSRQLDQSYDIIAILHKLPWLLPCWWVLVVAALCRRCCSKVQQFDIVPCSRGSSVWRVLPTSSLQLCGAGACQGTDLEIDCKEIDTTQFERMGAIPRYPSTSAREAFVPEREAVEARDPPLGAAFLCSVLLLSLATVLGISMSIDWHHSYFPVACLFFLLGAFLFWNTCDIFILQIACFIVKIVIGRTEWKVAQFPDGVPDSHRCIAAYCLLSTHVDASQETWRNCLDAYMSNLDPNCNIVAAVVSVTSDVTLVEEELRLRDWARLEMEKILESEVEDAAAGVFPPSRHSFWSVVTSRTDARERAKRQRREGARAVVKGKAGEACLEGFAGCDGFADALREELRSMMPDLRQGLIYLHRNTKVLKKSGQYLDLMVLTYTGCNTAETYVTENYGDLGRVKGQACFGYDSNLTTVTGGPVPQEHKDRLDAAGCTDISYLAACGKDSSRRFAYTVVLDKDTRPESGGIVKLVQVAAAEDALAKQEQREVRHGILQPSLRVDDETSPTWHMFLEALRQTRCSFTPSTIFRVFGRCGFFGKGLLVNRLAVPLIAQGELLPIDVLSHDTLEAMALCPGYVHSVVFAESPARNQITFLMQSTRWMLGEVKNHAHTWSPLAWLYVMLRHSYYLVTNGTFYPTPWQRVPLHVALASASPGARYLSQQSFRIMHAGPAVLVVMLLHVFALPESWLVFRSWRARSILFEFTLFSLFFVPTVMTTTDALTKEESRDVRRSLAQVFARCCSSRRTAQYTVINVDAESTVRIPTADQELRSPRSSMQADFLPMVEQGRSPSPEVTAEMYTSSGLCTVEPRSLPSGEHESRGGSHLWAKTLVLSVTEALISLAVFAPECITGVVRASCAVVAFVTGSHSWQPQDTVEREIEEKLSVLFIFQRTWYVPAVAVGFIVWAALSGFGLTPPLALILCSWLGYPLVVYIGCLPVCKEQRDGGLWRWIDEARHNNDASKNARSGTGFVALYGPKVC